VASAEEPWITEPPATVLQVEKTAIGENSGPKASNGSLASRSLAVIAALMLTIGGVFTARDYVRTQPQPLLAAVDAAEHQAYQKPQYLSKDIRDLQVMQDRVLADNPLEDESESPLGEIVPAEWRVVRLEHTEPNGTRHIIERGMPLDELTTAAARPAEVVGDFEVDESWQPGDPLPEYFDESGFPIDPSVVAAMLAERSAASDDAVAGLPTEPLIVGSTIFVDLPEHGISADFTATAILPCPTPNPGDGYLVTTKFIHENAEILDLRIEGSDEFIGTTASHPFWSEDRQQFVAAGDLRVGENLLLADDTIRPVESVARRATRETVYNIEVDEEHVFYVGEDGVLVHNECEGWHHYFTKWLGSKVRNGNTRILTWLSKPKHSHLHDAMRIWMKENYPDLMHGAGIGRPHMVGNYTLRSRIKALREFYRQYKDARGRSHLAEFETELAHSLKEGLIE
jgi:hypothetical protein